MRHEIFHLKDFYRELGKNGCDATLTTYLPDNLPEMGRIDERRPCLLICPGGGYEFCSKREQEPIALYFLPNGFNVFILKYSAAPNRYPTQLREVAAAMELIYKKADAWHCDTKRIAIMGFSAGGHLAVITADPTWAHLGSFDALLGKKDRTAKEIMDFSCDKLVTRGTPPAFLWHTSEDPCVPVMNSLLYAQALVSCGIPFELHVYPHGGHGLATSDERTLCEVLPEHRYDHAWMECAQKWLLSIFS